MITIKIGKTEASLKNGIWTCEEKVLKAMLDLFNWDSLEEYSSFKDLDLAHYVVERLGGKVTKITDRPKLVKGRVY